MFPELKVQEQELLTYLDKVDERDVMMSMKKHRPSLNDFINLIAPAAVNCIDSMREIATRNKKMHYGRTVKMYTPLYISNYCINRCQYCGFNSSLKKKRKRLSIDEVLQEARVIRDYGIDSLLLVSGEDPEYITVDYLVELTKQLKKIFSYIAIEIYPLDKHGYTRLFKAGVDGLTLYQETYDKHIYDKLHLSGPKANYANRLKFMEYGADAGFRVLGLGVLLGLYDWRIDTISMIAHAQWLKKRYWKSKIQFSFPRITAAEGSFEVPNAISDIELEQLVLAVRIIEPESEISISTRESEFFRDKAVLTTASTISAASSVVPGGYVDRKDDSLKQFSLNDNRSVKELDQDLRKIGLEPVYKDWDRCI